MFLIRFHLANQDFEEDCLSKFISTNESNFILTAKCECKIIKNLFAVNCLGKSFYSENFITNLTVRTEVNVRIFTAGRSDLIKLDFLQGTLSGSSLFGLGSVRTESGNKFLQLFDLFFFFLLASFI